MMSARRKTRQIKVGNIRIGGGAPISVQSMTNSDPLDFEATRAQILALRDAGCDIVRLAIPNAASVQTLARLKDSLPALPLVADIHFDYKLALGALEAGVDKIRINPGNIGDPDRVRTVADAARLRGVPIRIGVNSGSLEKHILAKYGAPTPEALAESALYHASILEACDFRDIAISVKASTVRDMIEANRILAQKTDYPLHLGVTEAGGAHMGSIKSAVGIGTLLAEGIGDTVRVSLTADPVLEVKEGRAILSALDLLEEKQIDVVSCPTCGRTKIDLIPLLSQFEAELDRLSLRNVPVKVAFMGCIVNGPGEAREADIGVAGGDGVGVIFRRGVPMERVKMDEIVPTLIKEICSMKEKQS
ncbi:MAG: flavodoxin-dependent (E)-4-hydroxy-3-methylbut-2-enyl-diphosphate synthase [Ruminococcaceae bacterium]|nr:flavodoxin-dependent (E)-4-hydroxy-3-methylbut-2-enyl-diphosphate synthase [Oscillospiraceae bacterium]